MPGREWERGDGGERDPMWKGKGVSYVVIAAEAGSERGRRGGG